MQPFPRNLGQRVVTASPALHYLLPSLKDRMIHLTLLKKIAISEELLFSEDLFISPFSASFLLEVVRKVLPVEWEGAGAICMNWESESGDRTLDPPRNLEGLKTFYTTFLVQTFFFECWLFYGLHFCGVLGRTHNVLYGMQ